MEPHRLTCLCGSIFFKKKIVDFVQFEDYNSSKIIIEF